MLKGKTSKLLEIPIIPSEYKEYVKCLKLIDKFSLKDLSDESFNLKFSVYPNGKSCLFFYNEENEILIFSLINSFLRSDKIREVYFHIALFYPHPQSLDSKNYQFKVFTLDDPVISTDNTRLNFLSSKTDTILLKSSKLISDIDKIFKFLKNSTGLFY